MLTASRPAAGPVVEARRRPASAAARTATARRPRVLYLVHRFPFPPDKGDRIRAYHVLRTLRARCDVTVVTFADEPVPPGHADRLGELCAELRVVPAGRGGRLAGAAWGLATGRSATEGAFASRAFACDVRGAAAANPPDAVLLSCGGLGRYLDLPELAGVRAVTDFVDLDSRKWADYAAAAAFPKSLLYRAEARRLRAAESRLLARSAAGTFVTDAEAALGREELGGRDEPGGDGSLHAVTNGVDLDYYRPPDGPRPDPPAGGGRVLFLGAMDYRPNVDAVTWFAREVWPAVRRAAPAATFEIVGRKPAGIVRALHGRDGIAVTGTVPDVRPHLHAADVAVAPLRIARGLQNKVLEAMAAGVPAVCSPAAAEGLRAVPGRDFLPADAPDEWAAALAALLTDAPRRRALAAAGRAHVEAEHDWTRCLAPLFGLLGADE